MSEPVAAVYDKTQGGNPGSCTFWRCRESSPGRCRDSPFKKLSSSRTSFPWDAWQLTRKAATPRPELPEGRSPHCTSARASGGGTCRESQPDLRRNSRLPPSRSACSCALPSIAALPCGVFLEDLRFLASKAWRICSLMSSLVAMTAVWHAPHDRGYEAPSTESVDRMVANSSFIFAAVIRARRSALMTCPSGPVRSKVCVASMTNVTS